MLSIHYFSNIKVQITIPSKWIYNFVYNTVRLSSNSSSSDSSDSSDSDNESNNKNQQQIKKLINKTNKNTNKSTDDFVDNLFHKLPSKSADVKINQKKNKETDKDYMAQIAEVLTTTVGGEKEKILSSLLHAFSDFEQKTDLKESINESPSNLNVKNKNNILQNKNDKLFNISIENYTNKYKSGGAFKTMNLIKVGKEDREKQVTNERSKIKQKQPFKEKNQIRLSESTKLLKIIQKQRYKQIQDKKSLQFAKTQTKYEQVPITQIRERLQIEEHNQPIVVKLKLEAQLERKKFKQSVQTKKPLKPEVVREEHKQLSVFEELKNKYIDGKNKTEYQSTDKSILSAIFLDNIEDIENRYRTEMGRYPSIFCKTNVLPSNAVELKTWDLCETKYMKLLVTSSPRNAFQEMIQWTEEGKLWKFPIDNEQGMEEEHNIHFSEHVFLECHLKGWCPMKGSIRHFMELVCVGLSKNPYMTVKEKYDHIMWYKEYFEDKNDLLNKLGLAEIAQYNTKKQITTN